MTTRPLGVRTAQQQGADDRARHRGEGGVRIPLPTSVMVALGLTVLAAVLRLFHITTSYDLFIDEATYAAIARDSTAASGPVLSGATFLLHPPIGLMFLAGIAHLLGIQDIASLVDALRPFVAVVGASVVGILYLALRRLGLRTAAFIAALLVALDPFVISFDSRVMLEAVAQLFAVLTIAFAVHGATAPARTQRTWAVVTAAAGSATIGTKETFGLVIVATLVLVLLSTPHGRRRPPLVALVGTLVGYGLINLVMIHWGGLRPWWHLRTEGLARLIGTQQTTGVKAPGVQGSLWDHLLPHGAEYAASYAILVVGGLSALWLLWDMWRRPLTIGELPPAAVIGVRTIAIWAVCACAYVAYAVAFGSLEEQMLYIAAAPCAATLAIRLSLIDVRALRRLAVGAVAVAVVMQGSSWVQVHTARDDVYARMLEQVHSVAPEGSTMAVTEETAQFVLSGYDLGQWASARDLEANHVGYVLLSDDLVAKGYGLASERFARTVQDKGELVLSVHGRDSDLELYDVRRWTSGSGGAS